MNRLSKEKSPYLLQHAGNPVDWYPWGDEAFEKAARENKPVFVSVGYSTCHWCHVMEKESFEDAEVAALMNGAFVSVKVDREERPDIDGVLMAVCQIVSRGNCGWPLNVLLTPDKKPFFAATYIPKHNKFGRTGMVELVPKISEVWSRRRHDVEKSATDIEQSVAEAQAVMQTQGGMGEEKTLEGGAAQIEAGFDETFGGFGSAHKFPSPHILLFLLRNWKRTGGKRSLEMVGKTLSAMLDGGINDHIGGGFHRYSTDRRWLVPHFEKMLYDQALISIALTEAWLATENDVYRTGAENTLEYVMRDMAAPGGGFFSAEDADSEGEEGKFYVWSAGDFNRALGDEAGFVSEILNIKDGGNFTDEAAGGMPGTNIPHKTHGAHAGGLPQAAREKLFAEREKRVRPHRDDKILTDWNGLIIAAFARAARAFENPRYLAAAENAADFITKNMLRDGRLLHRFRDGDAAIEGNLDDYAFMVLGLLEIYEAGFETSRLKTALLLTEQTERLFSDTGRGGFFFTPEGAEKLIIRKKEFHDGAIPCGNSVAASNLIKLSRLTGDPSYGEKARGIFRMLSLSLEKIPSSHGMLLCAMEDAAAETSEIVIAEGDDGGVKTVLDALADGYEPARTVMVKKRGDAGLSAIAPFTEGCAPADGKTTVYLCENGVCGLPVEAERFAAEKKC